MERVEVRCPFCGRMACKSLPLPCFGTIEVKCSRCGRLYQWPRRGRGDRGKEDVDHED